MTAAAAAGRIGFAPAVRVRLRVAGLVQGIGFRPFVYRLASRLTLTGFVRNEPGGVAIEIEGGPADVARFQQALRTDAPSAARIETVEVSTLPSLGSQGFEIRESRLGQGEAALVPDLATCQACMTDLLRPGGRRHRYPFTTCASCGPRYSIARALPYDRQRTSMADFPMCPACLAEYHDPDDRRFHAEGFSCPDCGPQLALRKADGTQLSRTDDALQGAVVQLADGRILAVKGLTGYQLVAAADCSQAVSSLRDRKGRPRKPFAIMVAGAARAGHYIQTTEAVLAALTSPDGPIVVARRTLASLGAELAPEVCFDPAFLGVMLPTTPLHHLLLQGLGRPLVVTSGNHNGAPLCSDDDRALSELGHIADAFLMHDRKVVRPLDDSVVRVAGKRTIPLRRARGVVPRPIPLAGPARCAQTVLAVGGHLKGTVAINFGATALVSTHLGDLGHPAAVAHHARACDELVSAPGVQQSVAVVACDAHPDYVSSRTAAELGERFQAPVVPVQHHLAHVLAVVAECGLTPPLLGVAFDGTGLGQNDQRWGGEFFWLRPDPTSPGSLTGASARRIAHLQPFGLVGGDRAAQEPRRAALGLLHEALAGGVYEALPEGFLDRSGWSTSTLFNLARLHEGGRHAHRTSSVGRLFDGVASLLGLCQVVSFEGEAAMALEACAVTGPGAAGGLALPRQLPHGASSVRAEGAGPLVVDQRPMVRALLRAIDRGEPSGTLAFQFHLWLAEAVVEVARRTGAGVVALAGGCFQNGLLAEQCLDGLSALEVQGYLPCALPPNDAGLSLGQLAGAGHGIQLMEDGPVPALGGHESIASKRLLEEQRYVFSGTRAY